MKKLKFIILLMLPFINYSQSFIGFTIGEKILNENIYIANDSLQSVISVLEDGYCYRIETKFLDTSLEDLEYVKQFVDTDKEWSDFLKPADNLYDLEYNRDEPYNRGDFKATVTDEGIKYLIFYDDKTRDGNVPGYVLIEKKDNLVELPGIDKKIKNRPKSYLDFKSYEECVNSPIFIEKKAAWEGNNSVQVENIELPYKFKFGMSQIQVGNHFKTILEKNSVLKSEQISFYNKEDKEIGISNYMYTVMTDNAFSFKIEVKYLNGKAVEYNYHHNYELDKVLREKIKALKLKYNTIDSTFGNNIHDIKSFEKIKQLRINLSNKGNLGNKM